MYLLIFIQSKRPTEMILLTYIFTLSYLKNISLKTYATSVIILITTNH